MYVVVLHVCRDTCHGAVLPVMVQHLMAWLPNHGAAYLWHGYWLWCGDSCHGTLSHGTVPHGMAPSVTVAVTLLIKTCRFIPAKIIAWVAVECDLGHSSLPIPRGGETVHHIRELRAGM